MGFHGATPPIITDGLSFLVDAGDGNSYGGSGSTWTDVIGGNNGTIDGATFNSNNHGYFDFDGSNDKVTLPTAVSDFFHQQSFSHGMWVKFANTTRAGRDTYFHILAAASTRRAYSLSRQANNHFTANEREKLQFGFYGDDINSQGAIFQNNDWNYLVCTFNSSDNTQTTYVNDAVYASRTAGGSTNVTGATPYIGSDNSGTQIEGAIANCHIYANKVLSLSEVTKNYNALKSRFGL